MRVFISSVRQGLEEERDALPGLITAIGHTPVMFEDFTAQLTPSRQACVNGVASADIYLLMLGPRYGHKFGDTGQSPTHDEWVAAITAGIPRLVYRKLEVEMEHDQQVFAREVGNYTAGVFYDTFSATPELLTKVAAKLRELEVVPTPLSYRPLDVPVEVTWRRDFDYALQRNVETNASVEVHVVPVPATARSSRMMEELASGIGQRVRASGLVRPESGLEVSRPNNAVQLALPASQSNWREPRSPQLRGVRVAPDGQVSVWAWLPGDNLGAILDPDALPDQIAEALRLVGTLQLIEAPEVTIAVGVDPAQMLSEGRITQVPRSGAAISIRDTPIRVAPDEVVTRAALDVGAAEASRPLALSVLRELRARESRS